MLTLYICVKVYEGNYITFFWKLSSINSPYVWIHQGVNVHNVHMDDVWWIYLAYEMRKIYRPKDRGSELCYRSVLTLQSPRFYPKWHYVRSTVVQMVLKQLLLRVFFFCFPPTDHHYTIALYLSLTVPSRFR